MEDFRKDLEELDGPEWEEDDTQAPAPKGEKRYSLRALMLTAAVAVVLTLGAVVLTAWLRLGPGGLAVLRSMELINHYFPGDHDPNQTASDAIRGMVDGLDDRWSGYLTKEQYEAWQRRKENAYIGVGLTYTPSEDHTAMEITEITPGGPAEAAGLQVGERITAIDGQDLTEENMDALVAAIQAETDREVVFTVQGADGQERQVSVITAKVTTSPVNSLMMGEDVGYIGLSNFYIGSAQAAEEAVEELIDQGAKAILFDMRYNPGGYADELIELLDYLLPEGPIFAERTKAGPVEVIYSDAQCVDLPMAVLINADSYSAAELFAAQLRESVGAPLIGQPTSGKGFYQQTFRLPDGSALNLSTGMYTTGGGTSLAGVGLKPDIVSEDIMEQTDLAIECLREKLE